MVDREKIVKLLRERVPFSKRYVLWAVLAVVPLLANAMLWKFAVAPSIKKWHRLKDMGSIVQMKPKLESLLEESNQLLVDWQSQSSIQEGPTAALLKLQKLAADHRVQIKEVNTKEIQAFNHSKSVEPTGGFSALSCMPVTLQVTGTYHNLARWIHAVENKPGIQINDWSLAPPQGQEHGCRLDVDMNMILRSL